MEKVIEYPAEIEAQDEELIHSTEVKIPLKEEDFPESVREILYKIIVERNDCLDKFYIVGKWIWCSFPEKPSKEVIDWLKANNFKWNQTRKVWQNACGFYCRHSPTDPREKYEVVKL